MMRDKEYLMLRDEILHLDQIIVHTINFFYAFLASFIAFSLTQDDTIYILLSYVVILPAYLMVLSKMRGMSRIGGYLYVIHEGTSGSEFQWETYNAKFSACIAKKKRFSASKITTFMHTFHYPFAVTNIATFCLFCLRTHWYNLTVYEIIKTVICILLFIFIFCLINENRKIGTKEYIAKWDDFNREQSLHLNGENKTD